MNDNIVDMSVIIAYLNLKDMYHKWAIENLKRLSPPLITCEAVIVESSFLLRKYEKGNQLLFQLLKENLLEIRFNLQQQSEYINSLLIQYSDVPISIADACLIRMSEIFINSKIITLDSDFNIYRRNKNEMIPLIIP